MAEKTSTTTSRLKPDRIQAGLKELPGEELAGDNQALERTYFFPTLRAAVAFVALVAEIGEAGAMCPTSTCATSR